jgi:uncharacterized membrane protein
MSSEHAPYVIASYVLAALVLVGLSAFGWLALRRWAARARALESEEGR